jgi:hypothetical protein
MVLIDSIKWAQKSCASFACLAVEASMNDPSFPESTLECEACRADRHADSPHEGFSRVSGKGTVKYCMWDSVVCVVR